MGSQRPAQEVFGTKWLLSMFLYSESFLSRPLGGLGKGYVRHFFGAILNLLRPSVPWCFPVRQPLVEPCPAATAEAAGATAAVAGKSSQPLPVVAGKCSQNLHFLPVSKVTLGTFLAQF